MKRDYHYPDLPRSYRGEFRILVLKEIERIESEYQKQIEENQRKPRLIKQR